MHLLVGWMGSEMDGWYESQWGNAVLQPAGQKKQMALKDAP